MDLKLNDSRKYTLADIITEICKLEGKNLWNLIDNIARQKVGNKILVNHIDVSFKKKLETPIRDGDIISMFPMMSAT